MNDDILSRLKSVVYLYSNNKMFKPNVVMMKKATYLELFSFLQFKTFSDCQCNIKTESYHVKSINVLGFNLEIIITENVADEFVLGVSNKKQ